MSDFIAYYLFKFFPRFAAHLTLFYLTGAYTHLGIYAEDDEALLVVASNSELLLTLLQQGALPLETRTIRPPNDPPR